MVLGELQSFLNYHFHLLELRPLLLTFWYSGLPLPPLALGVLPCQDRYSTAQIRAAKDVQNCLAVEFCVVHSVRPEPRSGLD